MCRYIKEAAEDPELKRAAEYARAAYAGGSADPNMLAWAVFWFCKHNIKFVVDEAPMMRLERIVPGSGYAQQDLLIRPDVLIRMNPREGDCDDFTMMACALLRALGVPYSIITIACGADDPSRWSHVFPMALCPAPLALDASHGRGPGWMVPAEQTYRWQAWDADGEAIGLKRPGSQLHGWVRSDYGLGGLGQCYDTSGNEIDCSDTIAGVAPTPTDTTPFLVSGPALPSTATSTSSGFNWTSFLDTLATQAAGVAKTAEVSGLYQNAAASTTGIFQSMIPIVLIVVLGGLAISALKK